MGFLLHVTHAYFFLEQKWMGQILFWRKGLFYLLFHFSFCYFVLKRVWISLWGSQVLFCLCRQFTYRGSVTDGKLQNRTSFLPVVNNLCLGMVSSPSTLQVIKLNWRKWGEVIIREGQFMEILLSLSQYY